MSLNGFKWVNSFQMRIDAWIINVECRSSDLDPQIVSKTGLSFPYVSTKEQQPPLQVPRDIWASVRLADCRSCCCSTKTSFVNDLTGLDVMTYRSGQSKLLQLPFNPLNILMIQIQLLWFFLPQWILATGVGLWVCVCVDPLPPAPPPTKRSLIYWPCSRR